MDSKEKSDPSDTLNLNHIIRTGTFGSAAPSRLSTTRKIVPLHAPDMDGLTSGAGSTQSTDIGGLTISHKTATVRALIENGLMVDNPLGGGMFPGINTKLDLSADVEATSFLTLYWTSMNKNKSLQSSIKCITEAVKTAYLDQIDDWTNFMMKAVTDGEIPVQPQTSLEIMQRHFQNNVHDEVVRSVQFVALVPGFTNLPQQEQSACITERGFHIWLVRHAPFIKNGEMYRLTSEGNLHYCRYWLDILLEPDFLNFILEFALTFNALHLTLAESYVFLTTALFWPEPAEENKATYSNFLYKHYLDALVKMVGPNRGLLLEKLREMIGQFGTLKKIQAAYCLPMDVTKVPYRSSGGASFEVIRRKSAD